MSIEHPYAPDIEWRFAVSRRFTSPYVNDLYREYIHPVLLTEGMVLECYYAADTPESENYWVNRMNLILELTDIHILIDIEPTTFTVYEIEKSVRARRLQMRTTLVRNFGERISNYHKLLGAPQIIIVKESEDHRPSSQSRRTTTVYLSKGVSPEDFRQHLKNEIDAVTLLKRDDFLWRDKWSKRLTPMLLSMLGNEVPLSPPGQRKDWLRAYQSIARLISAGMSVDEINSAIQQSLNLPVQNLANAIEDCGHFQPPLTPEAGLRTTLPHSGVDEYLGIVETNILQDEVVEPRALIDAQVAFNLKTKREELRAPRPLNELFGIYKRYYSGYIPNLLWAFMWLDPSENRIIGGITKAFIVFFALKRTFQAKLFRLRAKTRSS